MLSFCEQPGLLSGECPPPKEHAANTTMHNEFDIGEMLQCLGDALSGAAAQVGVDLVLYHGNIGLKQVYVSGDESAISFALSHVRRPYIISLCYLIYHWSNRSFDKSLTLQNGETLSNLGFCLSKRHIRCPLTVLHLPNPILRR